ncbi:hypothetical protein [Streptomyces sp. CRN 30]|uniref:hypothetical protein n=1 Tax=Streptomyces sp. CRN 30 TaxID=3075613 RepID=UPI002A7EB43B|nr:hypothetical protein [Streptomyces sp. CRN 30]
MSNQPHGSPYEGYDPYQQQPAQPSHASQPSQPAWQYAEEQEQQQYTQQWAGQTWETQLQPPVPAADAAETAYLPSQGYGQQQPLAPEAQQQWQQYAAQPQGYPQGYTQPHAHQQHQQHQQHQPHYQTQQPQQQHQPHGHQQPAQQPAQHFATRPPAGAAVPAPTRRAAPTDQAQRAHQAHQAHQEPQQEAEPEAGYGPPTLTGNARITDAQRARAEGRSPIIEPGMQPALLTAVLGILLSATAAIGQYALVVPLVILQAVTAAGWFRLNGMWPARQGIVLAFAGALTADVALLAVGRENAPAAILGTLGVWVLLTLVLQLRSHADPDERMYGLTATVASAALAIIATGYLAAESDAVTAGAAAVAVAVLARALPLPAAASVVVALLAGAGAGIAAGSMTGLGGQGALVGLGAAVCALAGHRVAAYDYPSRFVHFTAGVALPLAVAAPAVYLLGRALG